MWPCLICSIVPMSSRGTWWSRAIWVFGPYGSFLRPTFLTSPTVLRTIGQANASATRGR